jgi:hypothetical protein
MTCFALTTYSKPKLAWTASALQHSRPLWPGLSRTLPEWYDPRYSVCLVDGAGRPVCDLTVDEEYLGIRGWLKYHLRAFYATTKRQRDGAGSDFRPKLAVATQGDQWDMRPRKIEVG